MCALLHAQQVQRLPRCSKLNRLLQGTTRRRLPCAEGHEMSRAGDCFGHGRSPTASPLTFLWLSHLQVEVSRRLRRRTPPGPTAVLSAGRSKGCSQGCTRCVGRGGRGAVRAGALCGGAAACRVRQSACWARPSTLSTWSQARVPVHWRLRVHSQLGGKGLHQRRPSSEAAGCAEGTRGGGVRVEKAFDARRAVEGGGRLWSALAWGWVCSWPAGVGGCGDGRFNHHVEN